MQLLTGIKRHVGNLPDVAGRRFRMLANLLCAFIFLLSISIRANAQFTIRETFTGSSANGITIGGNAVLTSGKSENTEVGLDELCYTGQIDIMVMVHRQQRSLEKLLQYSYSKRMAARITIPLLVIPTFAE